MNRGVERALPSLGVTVDTFSWHLTIDKWEKNDEFYEKFLAALKEKPYDAVFSVNFNPLISKACAEVGLPYISWIYDSPIHIMDLEPLRDEVNRAFFFDRGLVEELQEDGYRAEYAPLAGDVQNFRKAADYAGAAMRSRFSAKISLVGQLYHNQYSHYATPLTDYQKGALEGVLLSQMKVYGVDLISPFLTEEFLAGLNERYAENPKSFAQVTKREYAYLLEREVTSRERFLALSLLSKKYPVDFYSRDKDEHLSTRKEGEEAGLLYRGTVTYEEEMPVVFANSGINLNISVRSIRTGVPLRVFDILSSGGFCLTNFQTEMAELFTLGEDLVCYSGVEELPELADYYLRHEEEMRRIAENGRRRIETEYTFEKQLGKILEKI